MYMRNEFIKTKVLLLGDTLIKKMCIFHDILQIGLQGLQAQNTFEIVTKFHLSRIKAVNIVL